MSRLQTETGSAALLTRFFASCRQRLTQRALPAASLYWGEAGLWSFEPAQTAGQGWPDFDSWCAAHPRCSVRLWVGSAWLHHVAVPADMPLADAAALQAYVRLQFVHYFGPVAQTWPLALWQQGDQRSGLALQEQAGLNLAQVHSAAGRYGVRVLSLRPAWSQALAVAAALDPVWACASSTALGLLEGRCLTWLSLRAGQLAGVEQRYLDIGDEAELQALLPGLQAHGEITDAARLTGWGWPDQAPAAAITCGPASAVWLAGEVR